MVEIEVHFTYADRRYWWTHFLKPGFSHVYVLIPVMCGHILISPNFGQMQVEYIITGQNLPNNLKKPTIMVKYCTDVNFSSGWFRPLTCVEIVKRILGINKFSLCTPYQLYRYLTWAAHRTYQKQPQRKKLLK